MTTREAKKAANREKLIDAAAAVVAKQGAVAASLDAIAEKAGLTKGAIYSNFESKEDLLLALAEEVALTIEATDAFADVHRAIADVLEEVGRLAAVELKAARAKKMVLTFEILNYALRNARVRRAIAGSWREGFAGEAAWWEEAAAESGTDLPVSGAELAVLVQSLAIGLTLVRTIDPASVPDDLFPRAFRLLAG
jgi:AcrR family transcriptional regulator